MDILRYVDKVIMMDVLNSKETKKSFFRKNTLSHASKKNYTDYTYILYRF